MLVPVLMWKIPTELKSIMSRNFGKDIWDVTKVLDTFRTELEAREKISIQSERVNTSTRTRNNELPLTCNHVSNTKRSNERLCLFCNGHNHPT